MGQVTSGYRTLLRLVAAAASMSLVAVLLAPAAGAAPAGSISGTVLAASGEPLSGACVTAGPVSTTTGPDGSFSVPVEDGSHTVRVQDCSPVPTHVDLYHPDAADPSGAVPVVVAGAGVDLGAITLRAGVAVSGTVLDGVGSGAPDVEVVVEGEGGTRSYARTALDGTYRSGPLPDGDYTVSFRDGGSATMYWPAVWNRDAASTVSLAAAGGSERTGVDAEMPEWAEITGRVTDTEGAPLAEVCTSAQLSDGTGLQWGFTGPDGSYTMTGVPPLEVIVQFQDCSATRRHLTQYWSGAADQDDATTLVLEPGVGTPGIDAQLQVGTSISGTVTDPDGAPLEGICVSAVAGDPDEGIPYDGVGGDLTRADGTYVLSALPTGPTRVIFDDCNALGPYLQQWWDRADSVGDATVIDLDGPAGATGIDATMQPAAVLAGTVSDATGDPVGGICVQASTAERVAGFDTTEADGSYELAVPAGTYALQYVDCNEDPGLGGTWYGGTLDPASATPVQVTPAERRGDLDVELAAGAPASVSGVLTDVRGDPMVGVCVVLYLADDRVVVAPTDAQGRYEFGPVGTGTYVIAFLGCGEGDEDGADVVPYIDDPATGVRYLPLWWGGALLDLDLDDEAPDPIAQGAELFTLTAGANPTKDQCVGCSALLLDLTQQGPSLRAEVDPVGLDLSEVGSAADRSGVAATLEYELSCTPEIAEVAVSAVRSTVSASRTLDLDGLSEGETYQCAAAATVDGVLVARSAATTVSVSGAGQVLDPTGSPTGGEAPEGAGARPRSLAFAG